MNTMPISEDDLHAYVDGQLSNNQREGIAAYLAEHPEAAERVRSYQEQNRVLKNRFNTVLNEAVPPALSALANNPQQSERKAFYPALQRWSLQRIAAGIMVVAASASGGWLANDQYRPSASVATLPSLPRQAAIAHVVYSPDVKRPVEIGVEHEDQLVAWLSKRLGTEMSPPKLSALGYELIGGRLLPGNNGPVAQFMYHDASGQRLTLYVNTENSTNTDTAFRFAQEGPVSVFYWIDGKLGYALSAGIEKKELAKVATAVYAQLEKK
jgi:anti-sigma factor RsiW